MRYRDTRLPSGTDLRVEHAQQVSRVELVNISGTGARLRQLGALPQGTLVTLCHLHLRFPAQVMWSDDTEMGVSFARPLSKADINSLRGTASTAAARALSSQHGFRELS